MQAVDALVVGEALIDIVTDAEGTTTHHPGGSAANTAVALARLGRPTRLATAFGADQHGRLLADHLASAGVALAGDPHVLAATSTARATLQPDGSASYAFAIDWRLGTTRLGSPRFLHVSSLGAVLTPGADDVQGLLRAVPPETFVSYDINARPSVTGSGPEVVARVEEVCRHADLVKASDEDLHTLYPALPVEEAARALVALGPSAVVVTEGGAGARWFGRDETVRVPARSVVVVDTIGAGDTFAAALLDALWEDRERDPREVLTHAVRAAAVTVSRPGADPPYRNELGTGA